jgi:hypothetical protein
VVEPRIDGVSPVKHAAFGWHRRAAPRRRRSYRARLRESTCVGLSIRLGLAARVNRSSCSRRRVESRLRGKTRNRERGARPGSDCVISFDHCTERRWWTRRLLSATHSAELGRPTCCRRSTEDGSSTRSKDQPTARPIRIHTELAPGPVEFGQTRSHRFDGAIRDERANDLSKVSVPPLMPGPHAIVSIAEHQCEFRVDEVRQRAILRVWP